MEVPSTQTYLIGIYTNKNEVGQFALTIKPKNPNENDTRTLMIIRYSDMWLSWRYEIVNMPVLSRIENGWRMVAEVLEIKVLDKISGNPLLDHLKKYFANRKRKLFGTKYDVCKDIFEQMKKHQNICCQDIISIDQYAELPPETVYWVSSVSSNDKETEPK